MSFYWIYYIFHLVSCMVLCPQPQLPTLQTVLKPSLIPSFLRVVVKNQESLGRMYRQAVNVGVSLVDYDLVDV